MFSIQEVIPHGECEHSSSKNRGPSYKPKANNDYFLRNGFYDFHYISVIYGTISLNKTT
jgi:hypothetical protein